MSFRIMVTGCSSGIGRALAEELHRRGHHVIASARHLDEVADLGSEQIALDVTSDISVADAAAKLGSVDVLVNNAGVGLWAPIESVSIEQARALFEVNFFGALRTQRAFLPAMRKARSGQVIQISSAVGRISGPLVGHYAASKHALEAMSQALRVELAPFGIKVAIIELGAVESDFAKNRLSVAADDYGPVVEHFVRGLAAYRTVPTSAEACAVVIADVIDAGAPTLMVEATHDATTLVAARRAKSDAQWEQELLEGLTPLPAM